MGIQYPLTPLLITEWGLGVNLPPPTYYSKQGMSNQSGYLDSQNLGLTKTGCNSSTRLCPLKIPLLCHPYFRNDETTRPLSAYA